jgi:hypothetical protein
MVDGHHEVPFKGGREEAAKVLPRKASENLARQSPEDSQTAPHGQSPAGRKIMR